MYQFELPQLNNCYCNKVHTSKVEKIIMGIGAINSVCSVLKEYNKEYVYIVSDVNTFKVAGQKVQSLLDKENIKYKSFTFENAHLTPDEQAVKSAREHFDKKVDCVIGVGSGVINDICKIIANENNLTYLIIATAPSMDGYASATSSMEVNSLKVSINSKNAEIIIGDTDILKNAPLIMLKAGLGDMLAKYISIAEWRISNLINGEYYCENIANIIRSAVKSCVLNGKSLLKRDEKAVEEVFKGLIMGGIAMSYAGVSRPASGVEHYFSHILDMRGLSKNTPTSFHGIQCGIATLLVSKLYEKLRKTRINEQKALNFVQNFDKEQWFNTLKDFIGSGANPMIEAEKKDKKYDIELHKIRIKRIIECWDKICNVIKEEIPPSKKLKKLYRSIGFPQVFTDIGEKQENLSLIFKATKDIRNKYVLSTLCFDLGIIDEMIN